MIGLGTLAKLAKGGMGPEEIQTVLQSLGVDLQFEHVTKVRAAFEGLAQSAKNPKAELIDVRGTLKGGKRVHAMLIVE